MLDLAVSVNSEASTTGLISVPTATRNYSGDDDEDVDVEGVDEDESCWGDQNTSLFLLGSWPVDVKDHHSLAEAVQLQIQGSHVTGKGVAGASQASRAGQKPSPVPIFTTPHLWAQQCQNLISQITHISSVLSVAKKQAVAQPVAVTTDAERMSRPDGDFERNLERMSRTDGHFEGNLAGNLVRISRNDGHLEEKLTGNLGRSVGDNPGASSSDRLQNSASIQLSASSSRVATRSVSVPYAGVLGGSMEEQGNPECVMPPSALLGAIGSLFFAAGESISQVSDASGVRASGGSDSVCSFFNSAMELLLTVHSCYTQSCALSEEDGVTILVVEASLAQWNRRQQYMASVSAAEKLRAKHSKSGVGKYFSSTSSSGSCSGSEHTGDESSNSDCERIEAERSQGNTRKKRKAMKSFEAVKKSNIKRRQKRNNNHKKRSARHNFLLLEPDPPSDPENGSDARNSISTSEDEDFVDGDGHYNAAQWGYLKARSLRRGNSETKDSEPSVSTDTKVCPFTSSEVLTHVLSSLTDTNAFLVLTTYFHKSNAHNFTLQCCREF